MIEFVESDVTKLMNPDLMSLKELTECLVERCILFDVGLDKPALVELARRFLTPLPQRTYKANRLGVMMHQKQQKFRTELKCSDLAQSKCNITNYTRSSVELLPQEGSCNQPVDRLKPVPSSVNYENKRIKLKVGSVNPTPVIETPSDNGLLLDKPDTITVCQDAIVENSINMTSEKTSMRSPVKKLVLSSSSDPAIQQQESKEVCTGKRPGVTEDSIEKKKFKPSAITWP